MRRNMVYEGSLRGWGDLDRLMVLLIPPFYDERQTRRFLRRHSQPQCRSSSSWAHASNLTHLADLVDYFGPLAHQVRIVITQQLGQHVAAPPVHEAREALACVENVPNENSTLTVGDEQALTEEG